MREVVRPLHARLGEQMTRHEWRTLYYAECAKIDLALYDGQPWRGEVWALLQSAQASDTSRHLSKERVLDFIADASVRACGQMAVWRG